jgi:nucleolar pre-ribosomal-associated protein 1
VTGQRGFDGLISLDTGKVFRTCVKFPLRRVLDGSVQVGMYERDRDGEMDGEGVYDPAFVIPLFYQVLISEEKITGLEWVEILRSNVLGMSICGLSSRDEGMRGIAGACLAKTMELISVRGTSSHYWATYAHHLQQTAFHERDQLLYILRLLKHAIIPSPIKPTFQPRLPTLSTLFLAHTLRALSTPSHHIHPTTSRFLLSRPVLDLGDVPMLYKMLYSSEDNWKVERKWIVGFVGDGCCSAAVSISHLAPPGAFCLEHGDWVNGNHYIC